jgi:acyl-CoA synthetase (AMP-forming)/AMP-acid ligase II
VVEVAVIGVPDEKYGEALLAIFAMKPGAEITVDAMVEYCRDKLAGYKIPRKLELIDALPRNPSGKVLKTVLREPYWEGQDRRIG